MSSANTDELSLEELADLAQRDPVRWAGAYDDAMRYSYKPYRRWLWLRRRKHSRAAYQEWSNARGPSWRWRLDRLLEAITGKRR